ncbi:MAG: lamin tail domain-containing protein [Limisphaerales bacterium]
MKSHLRPAARPAHCWHYPLVAPARDRSRRPAAVRLLFLATLPAIRFLWVAAQSYAAALPPGWSDADIGSPALAGSADSTNGAWTISASGTDICLSDQLHFAWKTIVGDGVISAKVTNTQTATGQAGVMFRSDTTTGAMEAAVLATASNGITFQWRSTPGAGCSYQIASGVGAISLPVSLRLVRSGTSYSAYWSTNDIDYYQVGIAQTAPLNPSALAGLAVSANDNSVLCSATFNEVVIPPSTFGVYRELWPSLNLSAGNTLDALTNTALNPNWPNAPDPEYTLVLPTFETPTNTGLTCYGQRLRTFVVPPATGSYTFWIASDNTSELFLSSDELPSHESPVAWVSTATDPRQWTLETNQQSAPILLQAGVRYYLEALMQYTGGIDNLAVRWQLPNGAMEEPLNAYGTSGTRLVPCNGLDTFPGIYLQPTNFTAPDGGSAAFVLLATNSAPLTYQWYLNGSSPVLNATNPVYVLDPANPAVNNGQTYTCVLSNSLGVVTSTPALLTVITDVTPPTVLGAYFVDVTNVQLAFSKPLEVASATNAANYVFTNGPAVLEADLGPDNATVTLTTAPMLLGSNYVLVINNIRDRATTPNVIASNTTVLIFAGPYTPLAIGNPPAAGGIIGAPGGYDVGSSGNNVGGTADQFQFAYQARNGDFDVKVRLQSLSQVSSFTKAGLMAREDLSAGGRFAGVFATPAMNGCFFEWRDPASTAAQSSGGFPANYPMTWLRLTRSGSTFSGFAGYDGTNWTLLGSATISFSNQVFFGFAVSSYVSGQVATAQFRDLADVTNAVVGVLTNPHEALGPCSRKTPIIISEIMYKPAPRADTNNLEFLEIYNSNPWFQDISGYSLASGNINYTFPLGTILNGGAFLVVAASPASMQAVYGITNVLGPYAGSLKKSDTLQLLDEQGAVLLTVPYSNIYPWPVATDGTGHSLVLANPTYGEGDPRAWDISDVVGGSPGQMDAYRPSPLRNVVINEFLANADPPAYDYVELYNHGNQPVDVSSCILTDDPKTDKFIIPQGTIIPAGGFVSYSETNMNFRLNAAGDTIYFKNPDASRYLDAVAFGGQEDGVATGRWPDGANDWYRLAAQTPGTNNAPIRRSDIVLNELMYDPISGNDDDQYVELYNRSTNTVNLGGWQLSGGISFTFPGDVVLAPDGYLVVARNAARLQTNYPNLTPANCLGNYTGKLSHNGEYLALTMPGWTEQTNLQGVISSNLMYIVLDDVTYGTGGRWGQWAAGGGSSLERLDPNANSHLAANWGDSDETQKSAWTNIECTGVLDNGQNYDASIDYAQIGVLDVGECLVDNVEVDAGAGTNLVVNPGFETGTNGWTFQGDHTRSSLENSGYASGHSLHLRASDHMWPGDDSCQVALTANSLAAGQTATLRFKARWLRGWPEVLLRLNGNWLEATGPMPVPANLGTPGARNSRYLGNAGPAIYQVSHTPPVPAAGQAVVVTARVHDPNGVQSLLLNYRIDPATTYTSVPMKDDGTGGDAIAGDGIFSATIPGKAVHTIVAFCISASDTQLATTRFPALLTNGAPVPECVVMFGDSNPTGSFPVYHLWITQTNFNRWVKLSDLSNEGNDCTIVCGTRVIYNAQAHFAGSPYHQDFNTPNGNLCHYKWIFPDDDQFLGATSFDKLHQPGNGAGDDASLQREQIANSFLRAVGVPWLNRHYVAVYVNGVRRGTLMEDAQTPDADMVKEHFPNDKDGWLYKMQPWFEFAPTPSGDAVGFANESWCNLMPYTTTGGLKKKARYRYNFLVRRTPVSDNDFTNVFSLVDAAGLYGKAGYVSSMENLADMENWMRVFAANHAAGNWDSFGCDNAQNLYGYMGTLGTRYSLLMFDFNIVIGNSGSWGPGQDLFSVNGQDPNTQNIYNEPTFRRMYWRALSELVNGPLNIANSGPLITAKYNTFVANGLSVENPASAILPWLTSARTSIASQLAAANASSFSINTAVTVSNNLAYVTGIAPVNIDTVLVNGTAYPITWASVTGFRLTVPLNTGTNALSFVGVDRFNQPVAGASNFLAVTYSAALASPAGQVVFNEIMCTPSVAGAEFVELFNGSTNTAFDLSGWQIPELAYTFPSGALMGPGAYLVLAANRAAYAAAYGAAVPLFDSFPGTLDPNGSLLTLFSATTSSGGPVVSRVRYSTAAPWPVVAATTGVSQQLIDPHQDNWRAGNWSLTLTNSSGPPAPQWQYITLTGEATKPILLICMHNTPGDVYIDDLKLVAGSVPEAGVNLVTNGDFESPLSGPWNVSTNMINSAISTAVKHSGNASLHVIATSAGDTIPLSIWENTGPIVTNGTYTLSYWYLPSTNGSELLIRLSGSSPNSSQIYSLQSIAPPPYVALASCTPAASNSVAATLPPFPPLWINEIQADNLTGITNGAGQHAPWLELFNPTTNTVPLAGLYLANSYTNLTAWPFPANSVMNPGEFKVVFADGQPSRSTANELHTSFALTSGSGSIALSRLYQGLPQVLDYVDYTNLTPNYAYGSVPDGQSFFRQALAIATPGASNNAAIPPSFIAYTSAGSIYSQDFDALPNPGLTSVNTANPVTINGTTYSLANPLDFAFPANSTNLGGLGIAQMAGWYGSDALLERFGATSGDQTTGGQLSFGLAGSPNRALGLLATSSTGATAFGAKFINQTAATLKYLTVQVIGEVWRQSNLPKTLQCYYFIDPSGAVLFPAGPTALLPGLDVSFPTVASAVGGAPVDGTAAVNQTNLAVFGQAIADWPPGAALWLVWQMTDSTGKSQGLAIDQLRFSASDVASTGPVLSPIADRALILGQTLNLTASATDTDQPPRTLTFSLGPGAPAGAMITAAGQFSWTPVSAPSTNAITVVVTDETAPYLSASQSFTVTVFPPPLVQSLNRTGTQVSFSWPTLPGEYYQVEYKDDLGAPTWTSLGAAIAGTGSLLTVTNVVSASAERFYRLRILY